MLFYCARMLAVGSIAALRLCTDTKLLQPSPRDAQTAAGDPNLFSARYVLDPGVTCYKYTVWCQGNRELYDLAADPYELSNRCVH